MEESERILKDVDKPPIDTHFHPFTKTQWKCMRALRIPLDKYLYHKEFTEEEITAKSPTEEEMAQTYRRLGCVGMPTAWDNETRYGDPPTTNEYIRSLCDKFPDVFITGWACVDPWRGEEALQAIEKAIRQYKLIGVKFHQAAQGFCVTDKRLESMWELIQDLEVPIQLHGGYTGLGTDMPGGQGVQIKYTMPYPHIEDLATRYPRIKIFILHVGDPWVEEFNALARHHGNVYRECSGMWPRYLPEEMIYEMNRRLQDKYVWGTDYPLFPLDELLKEHNMLRDEKGIKGYRPGILEKIMYKNAIRILKEDFERVGVDLSKWEE